MMFVDRKDAGIKLARALSKYKLDDVVVLALPRGGVVLGAEIAKELNAPLDLMITKKIGHPSNPEYAICAIAEEGSPVCNSAEVAFADSRWLDDETNRVRAEIKRRRETYLGNREPQSIEGKTAIIVDDGIATGLTMFAAIGEVKRRNPKKVVVAIPVTPADTARRLKAAVDDLVSLEIDPLYLGAVGAYYEDFRQVEDDEVISLLDSVATR
ncbi:MAG: phosphoribosyl transferase [Actinobacteria bacterium]|nr:phosphoribosyl transferase [Actinomycetota bacterium]